MNKGIIYTENNIIVETDDGLKTRKYSANIEEILETENNIEEIEELKKRTPDYKNLLEKFTYKYYLYGGILIILIILIVFEIVLTGSTIISKILQPVLIPLFMGPVAIAPISFKLASKKINKIIKNYKIKEKEILDKDLENQKEKLRVLGEESKKQYDNITISGKVAITRTQLINDLKRKKELIFDYLINKEKYIKFEKKGTIVYKLKDKGFSDSDIAFIQELIKEDTPETVNTQKHNKQKVKVAKKN